MEIRVPSDIRIFLCVFMSRPVVGPTQPHIQFVSLGGEADHACLYWIVPMLGLPPLPLYTIMAYCLDTCLTLLTFQYMLLVIRNKWLGLTTASQYSSVGIATDCELDVRSSIPGRSKTFFSSPQRPCRFWDPPSLLHNGYLRLFPWG
jgi:hypothetical protein